MGCGMSAEEKEGRARNEEIENQLRRDRMMQRNEIKMLLLGKLNQDWLGAHSWASLFRARSLTIHRTCHADHFTRCR